MFHSEIETILTLANNQHGVFATYQINQLGISRHCLRALLNKSIISRASSGVYVMQGTKPTWHFEASVAVLAAGQNAFLSHESALTIVGLFQQHRDKYVRKRRTLDSKDLIHVVTPRSMKPQGNVFPHRSAYFAECDKHNYTSGIRHVSVERALIDCAQQLSEGELDFAISSGCTRGLLTVKSLKDYLSSMRPAPGRELSKTEKVLDPYLYGAQAFSESPLESRVYKVIESEFLGFLRQHKVVISGRKYRLDMAYPKLKLGIEVDGYKYHSTRMHLDRDIHRQNDLIKNGWTIIHITATFTNQDIIDNVVSAIQRLRKSVGS